MTIPASLNQALGFNLTRVASLFRRELMIALRDDDLTPEQWQILVALIDSPSALTQAALAELTLKDTPNVSRILKRMERDGWIERVVDPGDARSKLVAPSHKAQQCYPRIRRTLEAHFEALLEPVDPALRRDLMAHLLTLRAVLEGT